MTKPSNIFEGPESSLRKTFEEAREGSEWEHKAIPEFLKELSSKVRWSSGHGQYLPDSPEAAAYRDGVETAVGMMYIDLAGGVKNNGMLHNLITHQRQQAVAEFAREVEQRLQYEIQTRTYKLRTHSEPMSTRDITIPLDYEQTYNLARTVTLKDAQGVIRTLLAQRGIDLEGEGK